MRDHASLLEYAKPAKIRNIIQRRVFERTLGRTPVRPDTHRYVDLGTAYGGWKTPTDVLRPGWVCYSVGVGGDVSYDSRLLDLGLRVRAVEPVASFNDGARSTIGPNERFTTHTVAIAATDGPLHAEQSVHPGSKSVSASGLYHSHDHVDVSGRTVLSLMNELGDDHIDVLKLDVEGLEYDVVPQLDLRTLGVKVFSVQLHHNRGVRAARGLIAGVEAQGYHLAAIRPVVKLTFVADEDPPVPAAAAVVAMSA